LLFQLAQATRRIRKDASEGPEGNRGQGESYYLSIYIIHNSRNESRKVENANAATGPDYDHCHCHPATHGMLQHAAEHLLRLLPPGYVHARGGWKLEDVLADLPEKGARPSLLLPFSNFST